MVRTADVRSSPDSGGIADILNRSRSATNTYFPQTVTVISLTKTNDKLRQTIAENKTTIDSIRALPNFVDALRVIPQMRDAFKDFSNEEILKALSDGQQGGGNPNEDPRIAEFDMMATGAAGIGYAEPPRLPPWSFSRFGTRS